MNLQPRRPPGRVEPFRHLIDEYKHQTQTVTCTCGWQGSSASPDGRTSDWKDHLAATRHETSGPATKSAATTSGATTTGASRTGATSTAASTSSASTARATAPAKASG